MLGGKVTLTGGSLGGDRARGGGRSRDFSLGGGGIGRLGGAWRRPGDLTTRGGGRSGGAAVAADTAVVNVAAGKSAVKVDSEEPRICTVRLAPEPNGLRSGCGDGALPLSFTVTVLVTDRRGDRSRLGWRPLVELARGERPLALCAGEGRVQVEASQTEDSPGGEASRLRLVRLGA